MADNEIRIIVEAEVKKAIDGLKKTEKETEKVGKTSDKASKGVDKLNTSAKKSESVFGKLKASYLAAAAALAGLVMGIGKALKAYGEQEKAEKTLAAAMKQSGTFTEAAFKRNLAYAQSLQKITTFGDEAILGVQRSLANFGIQGKQMEELTKVTLDLAAAKGMDLASAGDLVAKSVGSSTNALSRYGIEIEGAAGSTDRAAAAVANITKLFGGAAAAEAQTFSGQVKQMSNIFGDFLEKVGKVVSVVLKPILSIFLSLSDTSQTVVMALGGLVVAIIAGASAWGVFGSAAVGAAVAAKAALIAMGPIAAIALGAAAAIAVLTASLMSFNEASKITARLKFDKKLREGAIGAADAIAALKEKYSDLSGEMGTVSKHIVKNANSLSELEMAADDASSGLERARETIKRLSQVEGDLGASRVDELEDAISLENVYLKRMAAINQKLQERKVLVTQNRAEAKAFLDANTKDELASKIEEIDRIIKLEELSNDQIIALRKLRSETQKEIAIKANAEDLKILEQSIAGGLALNKKGEIEKLNDAKEAIQKRLNLIGLSNKERAEAEQAIANIENKINEISEQKKRDRIKETSDFIINTTKDTLSAVSDLIGVAFDRQIQKLEDAKQRALDTANDAKMQLAMIDDQEKMNEELALQQEIDRAKIAGNERLAAEKELQLNKMKFTEEAAAREAEIQKQYDDQIKQAKTRQARFDKANSIAQAVISTGLAIVRTLAGTPGGPITRAAAAATVGGLGAAQIAAISAQPIPRFLSGIDYVPRDRMPALLDEGERVLTKEENTNFNNNFGGNIVIQGVTSPDQFASQLSDYLKSRGAVNQV